MKTVTDAGNGEGTPTTFVKNQLVIAVPKGNPKGIKGLSDLTKPGVKVALCADAVPCGAAAKQALDSAGVKLTPVTLEQDVKAALSKGKLREDDAALVYRTHSKAGVLTALRLSLQCATLASLLCLVFGVPLAWLLARVEFAGRRLVRALITVPLVLPPVVGGIALLLVFGRRGLLGAWLDRTAGV